MMAEARKVMKLIQSSDVPMGANGTPDICQISDENARNEIIDFIKKVNENGGKLPVPSCAAT